jgi:hypothetical protein
MSRLSKAIRSIKLGPIVTNLVKLVEKLFGAGTGSLKKKVVIEMATTLLKRLKELDLPIPDNVEERIDELIEQAVSILNETGGFETPTEPIVSPAIGTASLQTVKPAAKRGRPAKVVVDIPQESVLDDPEDPFLDIDDEDFDTE